MDIIERLCDEASMADADDCDLHLDAVDEIEQLRKQIVFERQSLRSALDELKKQDDEIERLRQQNAELVEELRHTRQEHNILMENLDEENDRLHDQNEDLLEALNSIRLSTLNKTTLETVLKIAANAIAKATGGE